MGPFYYKYDLKKNLIVNFKEKIKNQNFQSLKNKKIKNNLIKIIDNIYIKRKKFFSKRILKKIIVDALEINYKLNFLIEEVKALIKRHNFDNVIWCCDYKYIANIIGYFKKRIFLFMEFSMVEVIFFKIIIFTINIVILIYVINF